jgi:hypothetical protein
VKPGDRLDGKPSQERRLSECERLRQGLHASCDDRAPLAVELERHAASCPECRAAASFLTDLDSLLARSLEAPEPPRDLVPGVMALVHADVRRARARAGLLGGALVAAALVIAFGLTFTSFDPVAGAQGLVQDGLELARFARAQLPAAPALPELPTLPLATSGALGPAALALAVLLVLAQLGMLKRARVSS